MSTEEGVCTGIHLGPFYFEMTTHGDFNLGVSFGESGGEGVVGGVEHYGEISFNLKDGFSIGAGQSAEVGIGGNLGTPFKAASIGAYSTYYGSLDTRE